MAFGCAAQDHSVMSESLTTSLRRVRRLRRLSQMELALRLGVSQRHVSFVESGRARPSRPLLLAWLGALDVPLAARNQLLQATGYAPHFLDQRLDSEPLAPALAALEALLAAHRAVPAMVLDSRWNIWMMNAAMLQVSQLLMPDLASSLRNPSPQEPLPLLPIMAHPQGFFARMINVGEVSPVLLAHLHEAEQLHPELAGVIAAVSARMLDLGGTRRAAASSAPVAYSRFDTELGELRFFSMFTTFGTPQHITLASLRVEHLFAADEATQRAIAFLAGASE
jgi:transcriptional regulator with XRE-family HTH domain